MKMLIGLFVLFLCVPLVADFEKKCSVLITLRFQSNEDASVKIDKEGESVD